jgi:hypothetical protein
VRWDRIDIVKVGLQKRAIQKELGIDAMGSCFFCGGPQLYWMRLNYAKDGVVTASKRIPVCTAHPPASEAAYLENGQTCGRKPLAHPAKCQCGNCIPGDEVLVRHSSTCMCNVCMTTT